MRDRGQYHPPMHRDDLRILPFPITHARTYNTRLVSSRQPSLNVHRGPSRRDRAVGGDDTCFCNLSTMVRLPQS